MKRKDKLSLDDKLAAGLAGIRDDSRRSMPPADVFWAAFRERARALPRVTALRNPAPRFRRPAYWALAAAAMLVLSLTLRYAIIPGTETTVTRIEVVEVSGTTDSFMIWEDAKSGGMIVWLMEQTPVRINGG